MPAKYVDGALQLDGETYLYDDYNRATFNTIDIAPTLATGATKLALDALGIVLPASVTIKTYLQTQKDGSVVPVGAYGLEANISVSKRLRALAAITQNPALGTAAKWLGRIALPGIAVGTDWGWTNDGQTLGRTTLKIEAPDLIKNGIKQWTDSLTVGAPVIKPILSGEFTKNESTKQNDPFSRIDIANTFTAQIEFKGK